MRKVIQIVVIALLLMSVGACGDSPGTSGSSMGFINLRNQTSVTAVDEFYLSPSDASTWGDNNLETSLPYGSAILFEGVSPDTYDARIVVNGYYSTYFSYAYGFEVQAGKTFEITVDDTTFTGTHEIINNYTVEATDTITELYISPSSSATWGSNQLDAGILPGTTEQITDIPPDTYDIKYVWSDGSENYKWGVEIKSLTVNSSTFAPG